MKLPHQQDYDGHQTELCESALLTVWPLLEEFHSSLALVGGLAPRYLCHDPEMESETMDVDIGISIAAGEGSCQSLAFGLRAAGFHLKEGRYVRAIGDHHIYLDFLTEAEGNRRTMNVEDILANAFLGVNRAVEIVREVPIRGTDLLGQAVSQIVRVCEAGPFLCLKLVAYGQRSMNKDLFDVVQVVRSYDQGADHAVRLFHEEAASNPAYPIALKVLQERFPNAVGEGYAEFCVGAQNGTIPADDFRMLWGQHHNTAVTAGIRLLGRRG